MEEESIYRVKKPISISVENNKTYQEYCMKTVNEVPRGDMEVLLKLFLDKASVNVGKECYDAPEATRDSILEFLYDAYKFLPVYCVGSAIFRGSLDNTSPSRLVPKLIYKWLGEAAMEYWRNETHRDREQRMKEKPISFDLHKYSAGAAICMKIDWYRTGAIDDITWDKVDLMKLAEAIGRGRNVQVNDFFK